MFSDIVRATCIIQLGGIWVDSTVYLPQKIEFSNFLNEYGFYTLISNKTHNFLSYKNIDCSWSTFLIGASKNSPIFQCFLEMMINTINKNKNKPYFLIDILLTLCAVYKLDNNVMLNFAQKNSSTYDCYYLTNHLNYRINQKHLSQITPIPQKLNWRIDINKLKPNSLINSIYADIMKEYL